MAAALDILDNILDEVEANKNELDIVKDSVFPNAYRIRYEKAGETPDKLKGLWTDHTMAKNAISAYISEIEVKKREAEERALVEAERVAKKPSAQEAAKKEAAKEAKSAKKVTSKSEEGKKEEG